MPRAAVSTAYTRNASLVLISVVVDVMGEV
jgi:hypothetical protein